MIKKISVLITLTILLVSCDILQQQAKQTIALTQCKFSYDRVNKVSLSGINITNLKSFSQISALDVAKLTTNVMSGTLPLEIDMNVLVKNPNASTAGMNQMAWILNIDNTKMVEGMVSGSYQIAGNGGSSTIPLTAKIDLKKVLTGKSLEQMVNFALNLAQPDSKPSTRLSLQVQPSIMVGGRAIAYPGYITVSR